MSPFNTALPPTLEGRHDALKKQVGETIRRLRLVRGMSQATLAKRSELHRSYIASVEAGERNVTINRLAGLAESLDVTITALFEDSYEAHPPEENSGGGLHLHLGPAIRQLRLQRKVSQNGLAKATQLSRTYLSGVEAGKRNPALRNVARIADGLGVSITSLFQAP